MPVRALLPALAGALLAAGCSGGAASDPALGAELRFPGAQYVPGATPAGDDGPEVLSLELLSTAIWPGASNRAVRGALGSEATAATLAMSGDTGYWILPAGVPDVEAPALPTFRGQASFSATLAEGSYTLEARAVDSAGHFGPPRRQTLSVLPEPPSAAGDAALRVALRWDSESDLDLHVVDPQGNEIFHGARSSRDAFAPGSSAAGVGMLDADSNGNCVIDGLRRETVAWTSEPPTGHYLVRVDTTSLCGRPSAYWSVRVLLRGEALASASGSSFDVDTRGAHDRGAGLLALEFDVP